MQRIAATLWPNLQTFQVYGANTNVGKTIVSTILCKAFREKQNVKVHYLKPISTGAIEHADGRHISRFIDDINTETLFQFSKPISPHLAARIEGNVPDDFEIQRKTYESLLKAATRGERVSIIETAGGVLSPAPSGSSQADLYRDLRLPALLVGDYHLGGIGSTISAYESLRIRGYDILLHLIFEEEEYQNVNYLTDYFKQRGIPTLGLPKPPKPVEDPEADLDAMWSYYSQVASLDEIYRILDQLAANHADRVTQLRSMSTRAHRSIWYPFTQHQGRTADDIMVIDSAYKNNFDILSQSDKNQDSLLQASVDGTASWWTQGLGHGNPQLALAAAYAAGRYGHVMFAGAIHEPALKLAELLLKHHNNPKLSRVFFTDNGSTGMEVAVKMALRASCARYSWDHKIEDVKVIGLRGSYHGDTIGVMDCSEPSVYNEKVEWYQPKGCKDVATGYVLSLTYIDWFSYPQLHMTSSNRWELSMPAEIQCYLEPDEQMQLKSIARTTSELFDESRKHNQKKIYGAYTNYITDVLKELNDKGHKFGALIMEPVVLGAGGMIFCDPLFQRALIEVVRSQPSLFGRASEIAGWTGLPVIFDEVFTGLYRLGYFNTNGLLHAQPDIVVNAKLLTGGLLPLSTTIASEDIFKAFLGTSKTDALLHGHSYTAHAVGCQVAVESLNTMLDMEEQKIWAERFGQNELIWSVWDEELVGRVAEHADVHGVIALGTVLAITLRDETGGGYNSQAAQRLQTQLLGIGERGWSVHSRVLGNVIYLMSGLTVTKRTTDMVMQVVLEELDK